MNLLSKPHTAGNFGQRPGSLAVAQATTLSIYQIRLCTLMFDISPVWIGLGNRQPAGSLSRWSLRHQAWRNWYFSTHHQGEV